MMIQQMRKRNHLTQDALAKQVGVSRAAISQFESGDSKPSVDTLAKLAKVFEVDMQVLLTGSGVAPFDVHAIGPLADQDFIDLPFLDYKALAHFGQNPGMSIKSLAASSETLRVYLEEGEMPEKYDGAMVVEVWGDSMEPFLYTGDRMIVWQIPESKWGSLYNVDCVVAYGDTVTIKQIAENDLIEHHRLKLRAANPPTSYFVVPQSEINTIWEVREFYQRPRYTPSARRR